MDKHTYLECNCSCAQHTLRFSSSNAEDFEFLVVEMYLGQWRGFFKRLWYAVKYICGVKSFYGAFDEVLLDSKQVVKLRDLCNQHLSDLQIQEGKSTITYEQVLEKVKNSQLI